MNIEKILHQFTLLGTEWVLYVLVAISILSVAMMIERFVFFTRNRWRFKQDDLETRVQNNPQWFLNEDKKHSVEWMMLSEARKKSSNESMFMTMVDAELIKGKRYLDRYLSYLGTVGSNAPFIGLFGTVLGIIRAFSDLAKTSNESQTVVMTGISEALVATAIGLLVAIPAVVMYNYFQKESKRVANHCLYLSRLMTTKWNM